MTFFVKYNGDLEKDPLDHGILEFASYESAFEFCRLMTKNGFETVIYSARKMGIEYQAKGLTS